MKKKILILLFASLVMNLFCIDYDSSKYDDIAGKVILNVLDYQDSTGPNTINDNEKIWDAFEEAHPDIIVRREVLFNNPFHEKIEKCVINGRMPDVFYMWPSGRSFNIHRKKLAKDLTPFMENDGILDDYMSACVDPVCQAGGYLAEIPMGVTLSSCMFVNTAILDECGLEIPTTYEELKAQIPVLEANGYEGILMANKDDWVMQSCLFSLVMGRFAGPDWADDILNGRKNFTDEPFLSAVKFIKQMYDDGVLSQETLTTDYGAVVREFATNKGAYMIDGDWRVGAFLTDSSTGYALIDPYKQKKDIELINFPELPGEIIHNSNSGIMGTGYGMSSSLKKGSKKEKAAWELIKWLSGAEVQQYHLDIGYSFPSLKNGLNYDNLEPLSIKRAQWYESQNSAPTPVFDSVFSYSVAGVLNEELQNLGLGLSSPEEVCWEVQRAYNYSW